MNRTSTQGDSLSAQIDALFVEMDQPDKPGAAVLVIKDGVVLHRKGYGSANIEHQISITPESVFDIASVSKQFAGMAISMLVEGASCIPTMISGTTSMSFPTSVRPSLFAIFSTT